MALARVVILIYFALILLSNRAAAQVDERVHEIAEKALAVIRESSDEKFQSRLLSDVALILARNGEQEAADELFQEALAKVPTEDSYTQLDDVAENLAGAGFHDQALRCAEKIRTDEQYGDDEADGCIWIISKHMAARKDWDLARTTCNRIQEPLWKSQALADLAIANFRRGEKAIAGSLLHEAVAVAAKCNDYEGQAVQAVEFIVESLVLAGMQEYAKPLVSKEAAEAKSARDWRTIREMESKCGNVDGVRRANREYMSRSRRVPTRSDHIHNFMAVAEAQARAGLVGEASETAKEFNDYEYYGLSARVIAEACIKAGRLEDALKITETIDPTRRDSWTYYTTLLDVAAEDIRQDNLYRAKSLLRQARDSVESSEVSISQCHHDSIAAFYGKVGFDEEGESWVNTIEVPYAKAVAFIALANGILNREQKAK